MRAQKSSFDRRPQACEDYGRDVRFSSFRAEHKENGFAITNNSHHGSKPA